VPLSRIAHTEGTPDQIAEGFDYYNPLRSSGADNSSVASTSALAKMTLRSVTAARWGQRPGRWESRSWSKNPSTSRVSPLFIGSSRRRVATSSIRVDPGRMAPGLAGLRVGAFWGTR